LGGPVFAVASCAARSKGGDDAFSVVRALRVRGCNWQPHREPGVAGGGLRPDVPVMLVDHDAPGDVEAEPGALAHWFGGEEGLESALPVLWRHPWTGVAD